MKNLIGIAAGAAVGALIGILYAPEKGSKTRKKIKDKSRDVQDRLGHSFDEFVDSASKKYNSIVDNGEEFIGKEKAKVKDTYNSNL